MQSNQIYDNLQGNAADITTRTAKKEIFCMTMTQSRLSIGYVKRKLTLQPFNHYYVLGKHYATVLNDRLFDYNSIQFYLYSAKLQQVSSQGTSKIQAN